MLACICYYWPLLNSSWNKVYSIELYHVHSANTMNEFIKREPVWTSNSVIIRMLIQRFKRHKRVYPVWNAIKSKAFQNVWNGFETVWNGFETVWNPFIFVLNAAFKAFIQNYVKPPFPLEGHISSYTCTAVHV